jgi:hypothetical protein
MSTAPREGARVSFVGDEFNGDRLTVGDEGKILSNGGSACHVLWSTGERRGEITLTANHDLLAAGGAQQGPGLVSTAVRDVYERRGNQGLLAVMAEEGYLAAVAPAAEQALMSVTAQLREDPAVQEILASLDDDEAEGFVSYAALALLRDAFGG